MARKVVKVIKVDLNGFNPAPEEPEEAESNTPYVDEYAAAQAEAISQPEEVEVVEEKPQQPKRAPRKPLVKKIAEVIPPVVVEPVVVQPVVVQPVVVEKNIKTVELVECPQCKKMMTAKSLKYSHQKNCITNKPTIPEQEIEVETKPTPVREKREQPPPETPPPAPSLQPLDRLSQNRAARMQKRIQTYQSLIANAF